MIGIYLCCDQPILVRGLDRVLTATGQFQMESFSRLPELLVRLESDQPDILLLDLTPDVTFGVLSDIKRLGKNLKLVLWVDAISTELAFQAMGLGVRGILRMTLAADLLVKCLQKVHGGEVWFEKSLTDSFLGSKRIALSRREGQLITLLSHGMKNKDIAARLLITEGTVKVYLSRLFEKVGVNDRFELALLGVRNLTAGQGELLEDNRASIPILRSLVVDSPICISAGARIKQLRLAQESNLRFSHF